VSQLITPYRSAQPTGRDGFIQLLRGEWTKFRTVRGWVIAVLAVALLTAAVPVLLAKSATTNDAITCVRGQCQAESQNFATGPAGTAVVDSFYFVHQPITAAGSITARVSSLHGSGSRSLPPAYYALQPATQPWAKAGIMIKASTRSGSAYAAMVITGSHGVRMQYDYTHDIAGNGAAGTSLAAQWLRLTRSGDTVTGYQSMNGTEWTKIGTVTLPGLPATAQAGMFVASPQFVAAQGSGDNQLRAVTQATASFMHVRLRGGSVNQAWRGTQVGGEAAVPRDVRYHTSCGKPHCPGAVPPPQGGHGVTTGPGGSFTVTGSGDVAPFVPITDPVGVTLLGTLFALLVVVALGAVFVTAEYRRGLIRTTVAASPRRGRILLAKSLVVAAVTFVAALIGSAVALPVAEHYLRANGWRPPVWAQLTLTSAAGLRVVLGTAAIAAGAAVLGLAAGAIFRRSAAAVLAVAGLLVVPIILSLVLPLTTASWLLRITPAAALSLQTAVQRYPQVSSVCAPYHDCFPLSGWAGYAVLAGWAVAALAGALYLLRRRDV